MVTMLLGADEVSAIARLIEAFQLGWSDWAACRYAHIGRAAFDIRMREDATFARLMDDAKSEFLLHHSRAIKAPRSKVVANVGLHALRSHDPIAWNVETKLAGTVGVANNLADLVLMQQKAKEIEGDRAEDPVP